jgi:hypothetical protein
MKVHRGDIVLCKVPMPSEEFREFKINPNRMMDMMTSSIQYRKISPQFTSLVHCHARIASFNDKLCLDNAQIAVLRR